MIDLLVNIKNFIINILVGIVGFLKSLRQSVPKAFNELKNIRLKLSNLEKSNLEIADFHIANGDIGDAILRLKIIEKFISPGNISAQYKLAWCYFIKSNFEKSLFYLSKCEGMDLYKLQEYIVNNEVSKIPEEIRLEYKNLTYSKFYNRFVNKTSNLHQIIVDKLAQNFKTFPPNCEILDLGAFLGQNAESLSLKLPKKYILTAVEDSSYMLDRLKELRLYDEIANSSIDNFLSNNKDKYDAVISLCSLGFAKDLKEYFSGINKTLKPQGYFVLVLKTAENTKLNSSKTEFLYNGDGIKKNLMDCDFTIVETTTWTFSSVDTYLLTICRVNDQIKSQ
jgi:hypothetical protein